MSRTTFFIEHVFRYRRSFNICYEHCVSEPPKSYHLKIIPSTFLTKKQARVLARYRAIGERGTFHSLQQVAAWLNMSLVWVYKQAEKGLLPFHRVGEAIRFDPKEIRCYLNKRRNLNKTYEKSRNPKTRKKDVHLQCEQEVTKSG